MELPDPLDQPDRITPDQEEAEDTDISDSEEESKTLAKRTRADEESESSDSDPGVRDPNLWVDYLDILPQTKRKLTKKEAKMKREEQWLNEDDNGGEEVKKVNESYKDIAKVNTSCGIAYMYNKPRKEVVGPKVYELCSYILDKNIMISPLNQEYTENSLGHPSLKLGAWKTQLEERYKLKTGYWTEEEDEALKSKSDELVEEGLCDDVKDLAKLINSQNSPAGRAVIEERDLSVRNIVGLYLGQDLPHRLAFECGQRFLEVVDGTSQLSKRTKVRAEKVRKLKEEKPPPPKSRRRWTLEEDKALMDLVLKKNSGGYKKIEDLDNRPMKSRAKQMIPWETFAQQFENRGANDLRDHWQVYLRPVLENPENSESVEAMEALDMDLLMAVRDTGAKNVREISWERVLQALPGNQLAFLKSRLKTLTKQPSEEAPTLNDKVNLALTNLSLGKSVSGKENPGKSKASMKAAQERNAGLIEYYEYLVECD